jgi:hypothetical protein
MLDLEMSKSSNYYIVDTDHNPQIYFAKNDRDFMNYFIDNIDEFRDVFTSMYLTDSEIKETFPKIYVDDKYDLYDTIHWDKCKEKIREELRDISFDAFERLLTGNCTDGNTTPFVSICKIAAVAITKIS